MSSKIEPNVASATRSGILTPTSDNSLNLDDDAGSGGKKRKREGNTMEDLLRDKFVVRPYPSSGFVKSQSLQPLMLLPRSKLPLSSIDTLSNMKGLAKSRLFESHVKILDLEARMGSQPTVLIARLDDTRILYAVERESRGLYVLLQLGSWINLQELRAAAVVSKQDLPERAATQPLLDLPASVPETNQYSKKKRLAIEAIQSMVKRPSTGLLTESQSDSQTPVIESGPKPPLVDPPAPIERDPDAKEVAATSTASVPPAPPVDDIAAQPTATDIFDNVRTHYLEALYLSKASLAYFAKGPLSRARAAFHLDYDSNLDLNDLIAFLESMVMSSTLLEKKYRDGVPTCVSLIDIDGHTADEADQASGKPKKRRVSKKMKPGKNGLYPTEDSLIRRWWATHDDDADTGGPGSSREELTKSRIAHLRIRETQLQMIVILEVLALQPLATSTEDIGGGLPTTLPSTEIAEAKERPGKSKKPDHLTTLIDVHIDRLCIWQSLAIETINAISGESQTSSDLSSGLPNQTSHTDNILRDFCVEVIAPFFQSRLPDRCSVINRKLGGPVAVTPPKPRIKSSSFSGAPSRPGAATKRPVPVKPRQSLKRVLTDDRERRSMSRGPNKKIALMRSATMPIIPGLKREVSEAPSLSSIPTADSQSFEASRGGILNSKRFSRREIDLGNMLPEMSSKAKKQAIIDAELKEAISALKKPNRELAGKALVETAEKRSASSRKAKKPVRNPLFQGVQISATPKANRQRDMFAQQSQTSSLERMVGEAATIPASSVPRIPQSASRSSGGFQRNPLFSDIQATPTRKAVPTFPKQSMSTMDLAGIPSSPLHVRRSSAQLFNAVPDSAVKNPSTLLSYGIEDTPIKKRPASSLEHSHPAITNFGSDKENDLLSKKAVDDMGIQGSVRESKEESIYKALGWDDNDDIDDLA